jgi:hypothetical protein
MSTDNTQILAKTSLKKRLAIGQNKTQDTTAVNSFRNRVNKI